MNMLLTPADGVMPIPVLPSIDWLMISPVLLIMLTGLAALMVEILQPKRNNDLIIGVSLAGLVLTAVSILAQFGMGPGNTFSGMVERDQTALVLQLLLVVICFVVFLFSEDYLRRRKIAWGEFYPLALWSTGGGMIMASTTNLLMIFIGLEILSIALYIMAGMARQEARSEESSMKYFLLGAFASAFLLMGIAFAYGATGSVDLARIGSLTLDTRPELQTLLIFGMALMLVGAGFKLALVPFHQWTPDVYQGAPTNVTAFMAAASKTAAVGMMIRLLDGMPAPVAQVFVPVLAFVAAATMIVGNAAALVQKDVKRVLGYSSVANAGYILVALLAYLAMPTPEMLNVVLFFLTAYAVMVLGTFAVLTLTARDGKDGSRMEDFYGLWKRQPLAAALLIIFIASQIGIPPTGGFVAKALIFLATLQTDLLWLGLILAVTSAMSAAYYLGIIRACFVQDEGTTPSVSQAPMTGGLKFSLVACAIAVFAVAVFYGPISQAYLGAGAGTPPEDPLVVRDILAPQTGEEIRMP
ncbi:MAG: NADH-quinone oxidoreductase subunit N [Fimbriimonadaceae bacterium]|nr:NADH-quinone oxidoreductase subunit N [Fimbriimonadaceae bacterium]